MRSEDAFDIKAGGCCGGKESRCSIPVERIIDRLDGCFEKNSMEEVGRLLEYWRREAEELGDRRGELAMVNEMTGYYRNTGDSERGLWAVKRAGELIRELKIEDILPGGTIMLNAATTLKAFGRAEEALPLYERALEIYRGSLAPDDARFGALYNNLGTALTELGRYIESERCYKKAFDIMKNSEGRGPDAAVTMVNMAHLYDTWPEADKALVDNCLMTAQDILEDPELKKDGRCAFVYEKCAPSFGHFGYTAIAARLSRRAGEIYERN